MGEVHDVHQAEDQREADGDQSVEQAHEEAARETLDNGLGCHRWSPTRNIIVCSVIASEAKQSRISSRRQSGLLRRFAPRNDEALATISICFLAPARRVLLHRPDR